MLSSGTIVGLCIAGVVALLVIRVAPSAIAAIKNWNNKPAGGSVASAVAAPADNTPLVDLIRKVKADAENQLAMSAPSRMTVCALISTIEAIAEKLPNDAEKKQAREECKSLAMKFIVTPTPADTAPVADPAAKSNSSAMPPV